MEVSPRRLALFSGVGSIGLIGTGLIARIVKNFGLTGVILDLF